MLIARRFWREAPLVEIKNEKDFEAWLQGKPRAVSIALAARASLRVLPLLQTKEPDERYVRDIVLPSLRAMAVSQAVAKYPAHETELATRVATAAFVAVGPNDVTALTANAAAQAARAAALPNAFTAAARAAAYAAAAADASADASASDTATFWSAVSDDATRVEEGVAAADIPGSPLWQRQRFHYKFFGPDDIRDHFNRSPVAELVNEQPDRLNSSWQKLKAALLRAKQDWDVWTDWYDDRLDGRVRNEERELAYVRIDDALWNQGPAIVNAEIKRRIEELPAIESVPVDNPQFGELQSSSAANAILAAWQPDEHGVVQLEALGQSGLQGRAGPLNTAALNTLALNQANTAIDSAPSVAEPVPPIEAIPEQEPIATRFGVNTAGVIDVVPDPLAPETVADALQREYYDELRFKAQALIELGPNQLGDLGGSAERFREALKERIEEISIASLWSRGNTLRSRLRAHDISMSNGEPDPARLPPLVAEKLRDLVDTWNVFIVGDPKGKELDQFRLGPQELQAAKELISLAAPIIEALRQSNNVATERAKQATSEQAEAAKDALGGIHGDQAINLTAS